MNFGELTGVKLWGVLLLADFSAVAAALLHHFQSERDENARLRHRSRRRCARTRIWKPTASWRTWNGSLQLKQQLEIERPHRAGRKGSGQLHAHAGGEAARRELKSAGYTASRSVARDFYTEVPFEVELDGPYYSMLGFFDRVSKLERNRET